MSTITTHLSPFLQNCQQRILSVLKKYLPPIDSTPALLHQAMHYSTLNGGKRIRPLFLYATSDALQIDLTTVDNAAAAIELIHCYSLIHDDLPAMDDDNLRRGQPTCHKAFNEATAILAGDALQCLAFELLSQTPSKISPPQQLKMITLLSQASGSNGMIGGQQLDLLAEGQTLNVDQLQKIHQLKTGALISASIHLALIASDCQDKKIIQALKQFANTLGLAFQIQDDILDTESNTEVLGKTAGADQAKQKATYVSLLGLAKAKQTLEKLNESALSSIEKANIKKDELLNLYNYLINRKC